MQVVSINEPLPKTSYLIRFEPSEVIANFFRITLESCPATSGYAQSVPVVLHEGSNVFTLELNDVSGEYVFRCQEYTRKDASLDESAGFIEQSRLDTQETLLADGLNAVYIADLLRQSVSFGQSVAYLDLYSVKHVVIQAELYPTMAPSLGFTSAVTSSWVQTEVKGLIGMPVTEVFGDVAMVVYNLVTQYRQHLTALDISGASRYHYDEDVFNVTNEVWSTYHPIGTVDLFLQMVNEVRSSMDAHMVNKAMNGVVGNTDFHELSSIVQGDYASKTLGQANTQSNLMFNIADMVEAWESHKYFKGHKIDVVYPDIELGQLLKVFRALSNQLRVYERAMTTGGYNNTSFTMLGFRKV